MVWPETDGHVSASIWRLKVLAAAQPHALHLPLVALLLGPLGGGPLLGVLEADKQLVVPLGLLARVRLAPPLAGPPPPQHLFTRPHNAARTAMISSANKDYFTLAGNRNRSENYLATHYCGPRNMNFTVRLKPNYLVDLIVNIAMISGANKDYSGGSKDLQ